MDTYDFTFEVIAALFSDLNVDHIARNTARYEYYTFVVAAHGLALLPISVSCICSIFGMRYFFCPWAQKYIEFYE